MSDLILCVPENYSRHYRFDKDSEQFHCWGSRLTLETNELFRQVIPYIVVIHSETGQILTYVRRGNENRLVGKTSIGFGGHIQYPEGVLAAAQRELKEELSIPGHALKAEPVGQIVSSQTAVDKVHLGVIFTARTTNYTVDEDEIATATWKTADAIAYEFEQLETWSQIALMAISDIQYPELESQLIRA